VNWQVVFEAPAQAEIAEAFTWYEEKSYGLGGDFLRVIATAEARPVGLEGYELTSNNIPPLSLNLEST